MPLSPTQTKFISLVAQLGTPNLACEKLEIDYLVYRDWEESREFRDEVRAAKDFFKAGMNETIVALAKQKLFRVLLNGVVEFATTYETETNAEGEVIKHKKVQKRIDKGVPSWAIKMGLDLIPELERAIETLIANNAIPAEKAEVLKTAVGQNEKNLREALAGSDDKSTIPQDEIIATLQKALVGGG